MPSRREFTQPQRSTSMGRVDDDKGSSGAMSVRGKTSSSNRGRPTSLHTHAPHFPLSSRLVLRLLHACTYCVHPPPAEVYWSHEPLW